MIAIKDYYYRFKWKAATRSNSSVSSRVDNEAIHGLPHIHILGLKAGEWCVIALSNAVPQVGDKLDVTQHRGGGRRLPRIDEGGRDVTDSAMGCAKLVEIARPAGSYLETTAEGDNDGEDGLSMPTSLR